MNKFTKIVEDVQKDKELSAEEVILDQWNNRPSNIDSFEFYHLMREEGYDGTVILNIIHPQGQ